MPVKPSGEVKIRIVHSTQKNGDIYVFERQTIYDPVKKRNGLLSTRLLSKIPKDSGPPAPIRPKKPCFEKRSEISRKIVASPNHIGMVKLI
jgi:hypothetical protein